MSETNLKTAYEWDPAGYYLGETAWMLDAFGDWLEAPSSTDVCPWGGDPDDSVFYKRLGGKWTTEKKPTCAAECIGLLVPHDSMTAHDIELRKLIRTFGEEEGYRLVQSEDFSLSIERVPEKTEEEKAAEELEKAKIERAETVERLKVEVDGMTFDADETSQTRMTRAIAAADATGLTETVWVLADNSVAKVTLDQMKQALAKAMLAMADVWTIPYTRGKKA